MHVERLEVSEGSRLRAIRLAALQQAPEAFGSTLQETAARPPESWPQQLALLPTFCAVNEGRDVGMVRGARDEQRPGCAMLISMWVAPDSRNLGIGQALVGAVVEWAKSEGFAQLLLDVRDDNPAAIALYARMGFEPTGRAGALPSPRDDITEHERALVLKP